MHWVRPSSPDVTIAAGEEPSLNFALDVPANADPGSHWGTLLAITGPQNAGPATIINTRLGLLILVRVRGDEREKLTLESASAPRFTDSPPIALEVPMMMVVNICSG